MVSRAMTAADRLRSPSVESSAPGEGADTATSDTPALDTESVVGKATGASLRLASSKAGSVIGALLAGVLTTASVPPFGWWPLAIVGIALLGLVCIGASLRRRLIIGFVFGLTLYGISLWWMTKFSLPGGLVVALIETGFTMIGLALVRKNNVTRSLPAGLVIADALRSLWPFGGLPLGGIDLGQADSPYARVVAFGGRLALVGVTCFAAVGLLAVAKRRVRTGAAVLLAVAILTVIVRASPDGTHHLGAVTIGIVQGGGPRGLRASEQGTMKAYDSHLAATALIHERVDVVLWPEDIVHVDSLERSLELRDLRAIARARNATVIPGVIESNGPELFWNRSVVIAPDGTIGDRYTKVRLVPYGEYFPFRKLITDWGLALLPARDGQPGGKVGVINTPVGRFAILISYEGFFDDRARGGVRAGGEAILIPTNASSYVTSQVPTQQIASAKLRALENGRWVAQAAPTGRSAFIDNRGNVVKRTTLERREAIVATIERRSGLTPYARFNDLPVLVLAGLSLAFAGLGASSGGFSIRGQRLKSRRHKVSGL
jgi:apolipoprotein N-acyltransferase